MNSSQRTRDLMPRQLEDRTNGSRSVTPQDLPQRSNEVMDKINILKQLLNNEDSKVKRIQTAKDKMMRGNTSHVSQDSLDDFNNLGNPYARPIFSRPESRNDQYLQNQQITPKQINQAQSNREIEISSHGEDELSNLSTPRVDTHNYSMINQKNLMERRISHTPDEHTGRRQFYPKSHSVLGFSNGGGSGFKTVQNQRQNRKMFKDQLKVSTAMSQASGIEFNQPFDESSLRDVPSPPMKMAQSNEKQKRVRELQTSIIRLVNALGEDVNQESRVSQKSMKTVGTQTETKTKTSQKGNSLIGIAFGGAVAGLVFAGVYLGLKNILKLK